MRLRSNCSSAITPSARSRALGTHACRPQSPCFGQPTAPSLQPGFGSDVWQAAIARAPGWHFIRGARWKVLAGPLAEPCDRGAHRPIVTCSFVIARPTRRSPPP